MNAFIPPIHQMQSTCVWEGSRVPNLQTEFNYLDSFKSYCNFSNFIVLMWSPWSPKKVPMWSPWPWSPWSPPHAVLIVPVVSTSSPYHPCCLHVIPTVFRRSPHYPQPPRYPLYPPLTPGRWEPQISKNTIRFELIEIFLFEICQDSPTYGWVHGLVGGSVDRWGQVKSLKIE